MRTILLGITIFFSMMAWAQNKDMHTVSPSDKTQKYIKAWTRELTLTPEQQSKAQPLILNMFTKVYALKADTTMEKKMRNRSIMMERKTGSDAFKALLTADQAALYDKKMQEIREQKANHKGGPKGDGKGENKGIKKAAANELDNDDLF